LLDAGERLTKTELARVIRTIVKGKDWTQRWTADVPGIAPADVSDLMRGKLARFQRRYLLTAFATRSITGSRLVESDRLRLDNGPELAKVLNTYRFHSTREVQPLPDAWLVDYNEHRP
jgi:predicted XRE-type DNA-binding protein